LRAPVLFQHSVRYALSARPIDRLAYFKALLEVSDLDDLSNALGTAIASLTTSLTARSRTSRPVAATQRRQ